MAKVANSTGRNDAGRLGRLPFVLLLTVGLLLSLLHCANGDMAFASTGGATVVTTINHSSTSDTPEHQLPCHSGHCLSHVTAGHVVSLMVRNLPIQRAPSFGHETSPAALASLPLFKPPRA